MSFEVTMLAIHSCLEDHGSEPQVEMSGFSVTQPGVELRSAPVSARTGESHITSLCFFFIFKIDRNASF